MQLICGTRFSIQGGDLNKSNSMFGIFGEMIDGMPGEIFDGMFDEMLDGIFQKVEISTAEAFIQQHGFVEFEMEQWRRRFESNPTQEASQAIKAAKATKACTHPSTCARAHAPHKWTVE